ncbi:hypothetical protein ACEPAG_8810 [Sanghuangporus baumii]
MTMTATYEEHWLKGPQSTSFYCRLYRAEKPRAILVFLHGFIEHIGRFAHVFPRWQEHGVSVFAYDQRGFGKTAEDVEHRSTDSSYGKTSGEHQLEDAEWAVGEAKSRLGEGLPVFVMGHSMGGGIVLDLATRTKHSIAGIVASAPLILQTKAAPKISRYVAGKISVLTPYTNIPASVNANDLSRDKRVGEEYLKDPLVKQKASLKCISDILNRGEELLEKRFAEWPTELPLLIVHGTEDKVTSPRGSLRFYEALPAKDKEYSSYTGCYHELHNEIDGMKEKFINECISWMLKHTPQEILDISESRETLIALTDTELIFLTPLMVSRSLDDMDASGKDRPVWRVQTRNLLSAMY